MKVLLHRKGVGFYAGFRWTEDKSSAMVFKTAVDALYFTLSTIHHPEDLSVYFWFEEYPHHDFTIPFNNLKK